MRRMYATAVAERLAAMRGYLRELQELGLGTLEAYLEDAKLRRAAERLLQLVVESSSDAARMLMLGLRRNPGPSHAACFHNMAQQRLLDRKLAQRLAEYALVRNVVVHDYLVLDDEMLFAQVRQAPEVFGQFAEEVTQQLQG